MQCEYVRKHYGVPAQVGRRVTYSGKAGIISEDRGHYVGITLDSEKPGTVSNVHPTDRNLVYLDEVGKVRQMTRSQRRYQEYREADWFDGTFSEWLGIDKHRTA